MENKIEKPAQNNYWKGPGKPGIPTMYILASSTAIRPMFALEELIKHGKLERYNTKIFKRYWGRAPEGMKEGYRLGKSPSMTVAPADDPTAQPTQFAESRLIIEFLAEHYSDGIWEQDTPEDRARDNYFREFACNTLQTNANLTISFDILPDAVPWVLSPLVRGLLYPVTNILKQAIPGSMEVVEDALSDEKPWVSGTKFGIADMCMIFPMDMIFCRAWVDINKYPKVAKWYKTIHDLPTFQAAAKAMGSYNMKTYAE